VATLAVEEACNLRRARPLVGRKLLKGIDKGVGVSDALADRRFIWRNTIVPSQW
jgi:hypothetical protein